MSSTGDSQSDVLVSEELVAYLDGELSPEESRRVEQRLAVDADYRQQLRELDQAWEALNALPSTSVDDHFARTTIEMVTVAAQRDVAQHAAQAAETGRRRTVRWAITGVAVAVLGFAATRVLLPDANDALIGNLAVIQHFDVLSQIDDVSFLRMLANDAAFEQLARDPASIDRELKALQSVDNATPDERRQWIEALSPEQKATLLDQMNRFHELDSRPEKQRQLQELERAIRQDPEAEKLQRTLIAYGSWLATRQPGEQEDLRVLPADERIQLIRRFVREDEMRALRHLSNEDAAKLRNRVLEVYRDRKSAFERAMRRRERDIRIRLHGPELRDASLVVLWDLFLSDEKDDETERRLITALSPEQQEYWKSLPDRGRFNRRRGQLVEWIRQSMRARLGPEELEEFFTEKLDNNQRERLLTLPSEQMQAQLERLYLAHELGVQDAAEWLGEFGLGGGFPPGPPPGVGGPGGRGGPRDGRRDWDRDRRNGGPPPRGEFGPGPPEMGPNGPRRPPPENRDDRQPPPDEPPLPPPDGPPPGE